MLTSFIERLAFEFSSLWGKSFDIRTDKQEVILTSELEKALIALHNECQKKKKEFSQTAQRREARKRETGKKTGRPLTPLPIEELQRRIRKGETPESLAKEFRVHRVMIMRRVVWPMKEVQSEMAEKNKPMVEKEVG